MPSDEIDAYLESTANSEVRAPLIMAVEQILSVFKKPVAVDCGCGAGSDIRYLRDKGFEVFAFDIEPAAISRCQERFSDDPSVHLQLASFVEFSFPHAHLIAADASLFFCPETHFETVWQNIHDALPTGGVFVGSFLGPRDTMASPNYDAEAFWPEVMTVTESVLGGYLEPFELIHWQEHELDGKTAQGIAHHWHIFSVVAKKTGG